ncbi:MAG: amino acid carrier protein [Opitutales bacterium]|nr:amino acid carrier protein [Opitutales bacterium]
MEDFVQSIYRIIWGFPLLLTIFGIGLYFSVKLKFIQFRGLGQAFRYLLPAHRKQENGLIGDISTFASLCTALSATLGTGNIVGIAVAVSVGGPGTLFWIVLSSIFSLAIKYCEGFLAIRYRKVGNDGKIAGGPMYYIEKGLHSRFLAKFFAISGMGVALIGIGTLAQTNSIAAAAASFGVPVGFTTVVLGIIVALVIFGGIHRIAEVAEKVVPFMTVLYLGTALVVLILRIDMLFPAIRLIIADAFSPKSFVGGTLGSAIIASIQTGMSRGIFCHEAGLGSAAIAAAAAKTQSPVQQGLICMVGAFLSIIVCIITGLVLVTADPTGVIETSMTASAFEHGLGIPHLGNSIVSLSIIFFAFTTIIGWNYYGEKCVQYFFGTGAIFAYRTLFLFFVIAGPFLQIKTAFVIADIVIGLMAIPNIISLVALRKEIIAGTKNALKSH